MKFRIFVSLKNGVHDPQGEATSRALRSLGLQQVENARIGKFIDVDIQAADAAQGQKIAEKAAQQLLANVVIEKYTVEGPLP